MWRFSLKGYYRNSPQLQDFCADLVAVLLLFAIFAVPYCMAFIISLTGLFHRFVETGRGTDRERHSASVNALMITQGMALMMFFSRYATVALLGMVGSNWTGGYVLGNPFAFSLLANTAGLVVFLIMVSLASVGAAAWSWYSDPG